MSNLIKHLYSAENITSAWLSVKKNASSSKNKSSNKELENISKNLLLFIIKLKNEILTGYRFSQATAVLKEKKDGKKRPIIIATIKDRIVQRAILNILQSRSPDILKLLGNIPTISSTTTSAGGVPDRGVPYAMELVKKAIANKCSYYITSDIKDFFTKIPKLEVVKYIFAQTQDADFTALFESALTVDLKNINAEEIKQHSFLFPDDEHGVAQGSSLSVFSGNVVLNNLDIKMNDRDITMIRYIDDFVIIGKSLRKMKMAFSSSQNILHELGMSAYTAEDKDTKYSQGTIRKGFNFLGCTITTTKIIPSVSAQNLLIEKVQQTIKDASLTIDKFENNILRRNEGTLIPSLFKIDKQIKGWGDHYSFCNNDQPFNKLDKKIDKIILGYLYKQLRLIKSFDPLRKRRSIGISLLKDRKKTV